MYPIEAIPLDRQGRAFSPEAWSRLDGASPVAGMVAYFANVSLEASRVPGWQDMAVSLTPDAPIVVLDTVTLERLDHFAELDYSSNVRARARPTERARGLA